MSKGHISQLVNFQNDAKFLEELRLKLASAVGKEGARATMPQDEVLNECLSDDRCCMVPEQHGLRVLREQVAGSRDVFIFT